jgi:2-polyprenyl-6-methoxyphenol hydroxylase-like FAD-dependent oxidoreductase
MCHPDQARTIGDVTGIPWDLLSKGTDMNTVIIGAGPTGLYLAIGLARRGHAVRLVDRDAGPAPDGNWERRGVMQFHHPHAFRAQVLEALRAEMPEAEDALLTAGAVPILMPGPPGGSGIVAGLRCRRVLFETVLRAAAFAQPGMTAVTGHAGKLVVNRGRAAGLRIDGPAGTSATLDADLVIDASGRAGWCRRGRRARSEGGDCGTASVSRLYRLRPGAEPGPTNHLVGAAARYPGYQAYVFPHDAGTFSAVLVRAAGDRELAVTRSITAFEVAAAAGPSSPRGRHATAAIP